MIFMVMQCLSFFQQEFGLNKYTKNISKRFVVGVDVEYPKGLWELNNDYPLAP